MVNPIDLRSDTVTKPTLAMREAMARAEVGDDVYGEDPTVNRLQEMAASILGKQASLFVPSGTMGNLIAILGHCGRGDEVILGNLSHSYLYEAGGASALGGVHTFPLANQPDGTLAIDQIRLAVRPDDPHFPRTRLIALENTHNRCGGTAVPGEFFHQIRTVADHYGLKVHLDGARIFNAAVALDLDVASLAGMVDSITFCLSKGLCAPVGSLLCGDLTFIAEARRIRKQLGGGMRQVGILAAAGLVALTKMVERLSDDHRRAERLATGLGEIPGIRVEPVSVRTNMVFIGILPEVPIGAQGIAEHLKAEQILVGSTGARRMRLVTHNDVDDSGIERAIQVFTDVMSRL